MNRLPKTELLHELVLAAQESGWNVIFLTDVHPFRLRISKGDEHYTVCIYIWNITHGGGRNRPENEFRVQITGIDDRFRPEPAGKTLILGWWGETGVFAGWDYNFHQGPLGSSPSLQIRREYLEAAHQHGFAACPKGNEELAIAFRPDFLVEYIRHLETLHQFGKSQADLRLLDSVATDPNTVNESDLEMVSYERQTVIRSVQQRLRSSSFRQRVLKAYNFQCAFCGLQLDLVQAAHILPVSHEAATDATHNGVAVCYLHHAAYDKALITFDDQYQTYVDDIELGYLSEIERGAGRESFERALGLGQAFRPSILLPQVVSDRPHREFVRLANQSRGWKF